MTEIRSISKHPMTATSTKYTEQIERTAREWFVLMQSDTVADAEKTSFEEWLNDRPEHRVAYQQLDTIWDQLAVLAETPEGARLRRSVEAASEGGRFGRLFRPASSGGFFFNRPLAAAAAVALFAVCAGLLWFRGGNEIAPELTYATATSEIRVVQLSDGSQVTLGAESELRVAFSEDLRALTLLDGEAFFDVTSDPERPFVVEVNDIYVKAVGTKFDVHKRYAGTNVAVLEGRVKVATNTGAAQTDATPLFLSAGEQVSKPQDGAFTDVGSVSELEFGAWRNGRLVFRDAHLIDVVTDANRYFEGSISLQASDIYEERVNLTLRTDQIDQLPAMLELMDLPIEVRESPGGRITIGPAADGNP